MRPPSEAQLRHALGRGYGLDIRRLAVEGDGADSTACSWRGTTSDGRGIFVKLRQDARPAAILVPRHLAAAGLPEVVAARSTLGGDAWLEIDGWTAVVTDLVDGPTAFRAGLDLDGWRRLGAFSRRLHAVELPPDLAALVRVEDFDSGWPERARALDRRIEAIDEVGLDEDALAVRRRWIVERPTIRRVVELADELAARLRARPPADRGPFVLCHADFHVANVLIDRSGGLHIVDWDELVFAPPERDLVFVRGSVVAGVVSDAEADAFEAGYGPLRIDRDRLAWYRIDWAVQDLAGFAEEVLFEPDRDPPTRPRARRLFEALFRTGDEVEAALAVARAIGRDDRA